MFRNHVEIKTASCTYFQAIKSSKLDSSTFVLLSLDFLEKKLKSKMDEKDKSAILDNFSHNNVNVAIDIILKIFQQHEELIGSELISHVQLSQSQFHLKDHPLKNQSRRFFESIFSLQLWGSLSQKEFKSIEKLSVFINEYSPGFIKINAVDSIEAADLVIGPLREFGETHPMIKQFQDDFRKDCLVLGRKDRGQIKKTRPLSCNPGILTSLDPCFFNIRKSEAEEGRIVDMFHIDEEKGDFSKTNKHIPFVNSVSGTTFMFVGILRYFMEKFKDDLALEQHVNDIVKAFLAFTCKNGYHSLAEMLCVLNSPDVESIFTGFSVKLNLHFSQSILESAYRESAIYAKKTTLQVLVDQEIFKSQARPLIKTASAPSLIKI